MGLLYVGSERNVFGAEDRIVVTLAAALHQVAKRQGAVCLISEYADEDGVTTVPVYFSPRFRGMERCWAEPTDENTPVDAEYLQRALQSAEGPGGTIVLDCDDDVVTDPDIRREVIARAFEHHLG